MTSSMLSGLKDGGDDVTLKQRRAKKCKKDEIPSKLGLSIK